MRPCTMRNRSALTQTQSASWNALYPDFATPVWPRKKGAKITTLLTITEVMDGFLSSGLNDLNRNW